MSETNTNESIPTLPAADPLEATQPVSADGYANSLDTTQPVKLTDEEAAALEAAQAAATGKPNYALVERVNYTLNSADAAAINANLVSDYVKEGLQVSASRDADGNLFVQVHEAKVFLGVS